MLITQRQAILRIRKEAGLSEASAIAKVAAMPKTRDGQRYKVSRFAVELVIAEVEVAAKPAPTKCKPFSARKVAQIRTFGVMPRERV